MTHWHRWTDDERAVIRELREPAPGSGHRRATVAQIAAVFGITLLVLRREMHKMGMHGNAVMPGAYTPAELARAAKLRRRGATWDAITEALGRPNAQMVAKHVRAAYPGIQRGPHDGTAE